MIIAGIVIKDGIETIVYAEEENEITSNLTSNLDVNTI